MKYIGTIKNIDLEKLRECILSRAKHEEELEKEKKETFDRMYEERVFPETMQVRYDYGSGFHDVIYGDRNHEYACRKMFNSYFDIWNIDDYYKDNSEKQNRRNLGFLTELEIQYNYAMKYGQPLHYSYQSNMGYYISTPAINAFVPEDCVQAEPFVDYSDTPLHLIGGNVQMSKSLPSIGEETENSLKSKLEDKKAEIDAKMQEIKGKEEEQKAEIEEMKRAIEEKYRSVFELMEAKKEELERTKKQLEGQLFVLDTQLYGIRCFFGETVNFTQIHAGNSASVEEPLVMYQKIRFLDEELAKYAAIYGMDGDGTGMFEDLLKCRQDMRDLFFPEGKTLSLVRISKDGVHYKSGTGVSMSGSGMVTISNIMDEYEIYHGNQIAILVRNGDNCYIGWTETDRINISGENAFLTPKEASVDNDADIKKDYFGNEVLQKTSKEEIASRFFVFSIAQGLIENSKLLELPEGVSVTQNSPYVVFSMADSWLEDNTYGSYDDIMEKCCVNQRKGDTILTLCNLRAEGYTNGIYINDRGRGDANRTHDVHASDNTFYKINLAELDDNENIITYEYKKKTEKKWQLSSWETVCEENEWKEDFEKRHNTEDYEYRNFAFRGKKMHIFISLEKECLWTESHARANFELYSDEYIDMTFLNTVYIKYIITNRKMPGRNFAHCVNFSYILPYMNRAMEFLKEREKEEEKLISHYTALSENWQVDLTDWKIAHNVHEITEYQAKRFAKWYKEQKN